MNSFYYKCSDMCDQGEKVDCESVLGLDLTDKDPSGLCASLLAFAGALLLVSGSLGMLYSLTYQSIFVAPLWFYVLLDSYTIIVGLTALLSVAIPKNTFPKARSYSENIFSLGLVTLLFVQLIQFTINEFTMTRRGRVSMLVRGLQMTQYAILTMFFTMLLVCVVLWLLKFWSPPSAEIQCKDNRCEVSHVDSA